MVSGAVTSCPGAYPVSCDSVANTDYTDYSHGWYLSVPQRERNARGTQEMKYISRGALALAGAAVAGLAMAGTAGTALADTNPGPIAGSVVVVTAISMSASTAAFTYGGPGATDTAGTPTQFPKSGGNVVPDYSLTIESGDAGGYSVETTTTDFSGSGATFPASAATEYVNGSATMASAPSQFGIAGSNTPVLAAQHPGASAQGGDVLYVYDSVLPPASLAGGLLTLTDAISQVAIGN